MSTAQNKVTFGLSNGCYAVATATTTGYSFGTVKQLPNLRTLTATVVGGKTDVYADNKIVSTLTSYAGQEITLALSELSDDFKKDVLGYVVDDQNGLNEVANAQIKTFAFGCQIEGDIYARRIWYFLCTATNPGESSSTKTDSPEVNEPEITITVRPMQVGENEVVRRIMKAGETAYNTFLNTVSVPTFS